METMVALTCKFKEPPNLETTIHQAPEREHQVDSNTAFFFNRFMKQARRGIKEP